MTEYFADTFYWLAVLNPEDANYARVSGYQVMGRLVTTSAVCVEVMDGFSQRRFRPLALRFWNDLIDVPTLVVVQVDGPMMERAVDLFARRPDKDWSLTDCISFVVMSDRGIRVALTGDRHFEQAGFEIAFKP